MPPCPVAAAMPVVMQKKQGVHDPVRARCEHRVQLRQVLRDDPVRPGYQADVHEGFFDVAASSRIRSRRRWRWSPPTRILGERLRGRARERQEGGPEDRLRQDLSADDHRLRADRAAIQATNPDIVVTLLLPARLGRHGQGGERDRLQAEDDRRRHGRPAGDRVQAPARPAAQRLGQLRDLGAVERR